MKIKISLAFVLLAAISALAWKEINTVTPTEQLFLKLLKENIDNESIYEGTLSYVSGRFFLNEKGMLQVDDVRYPLCRDLRSDGYNCKDGTLTTKLSIDPSIEAIQLIQKAYAKISQAEAVIRIHSENN